MEAQLISCVRDSLDSFLYNNAKFMAERLYAQYTSEENLLLLATVYMRTDQAYRAYHLLSGACALNPKNWNSQGRYLLAQCCMQLGKYDEAKNALLDEDRTFIPGGAAGCYLLGRLHSLTDNPSTAISCYQAALLKDPLLWSAYEGLCQLGHSDDAAALLRHAETDISAIHAQQPHSSRSASPQDTVMQTPSSSLSAEAPAFVPSPGAVWPRSSSLKPKSSQDLPTASGAQPTPASEESSPFFTPSPGTIPLQVPALVRRGGPAGPRETPAPTPMLRTSERRSAGTGTDRWKFLDEGKMRKVSNRLFADSTSRPSPSSMRGVSGNGMPLAEAPGSMNHSQPQFTFKAGQGSPSGAAEPNSELSNGSVGHMPHGQRSPKGMLSVLALLLQLGEGYGLLCRYKLQEALRCFEGLSNLHYQTAWVMSQIGRACYETVDFAGAASSYERARQLDPCQLEGMEYYSTVLWHLKRDVDLSHLAQEAIALDRLDPRSWCIMGNCFSLQKDHDAALKFFQRALQLDASFTYAYTLAGHENLALEQFDKSMACYRNAMRLDPRHYNAWYGVGQIYYRQEKYEMAAYHFESSLKINGHSSVLRCYFGMALAKLGRLDQAQAQLQEAIEADPHNPLARFEHANVLIAADRLEDALDELEALKDMAPREASVYFQLGKIYRRMDNSERALLYFSTALDLKPSSADVNLIKSAIEKLRISNESDEEEM